MRSLTEPVKETLKVMEEPLKEACKRGQAELLGSHDDRAPRTAKKRAPKTA